MELYFRKENKTKLYAGFAKNVLYTMQNLGVESKY